MFVNNKEENGKGGEMSNEIITIDQVENKIIEVHGNAVLLDSDVAELYGTETREVNRAVKTHPDKFPNGYTVKLTDKELKDLRWKNSTAKLAKTRIAPTVFTEKGLYMLATILKSEKATKTTIAIIEAFTKIRMAGRIADTLAVAKTIEEKIDASSKAGLIIGSLIAENMTNRKHKTSVEFNLLAVKIKHEVEWGKDKK
jgi:phage regulator Rha-like protein